jgi:hypothetical protein
MSAFAPRSATATAAWLATSLVVAISLCALQGGCVRRRMTICTNPPGAQVYIDDYPIGTTPISANYTYYGKRKIRLVRDGYETMTILQPVSTPWYEIPPLDFVSENLVPVEIQDRRTFSYQLTPQAVVPTQQLVDRAEQLRRGGRSVGPVAPSQFGQGAVVAPPAGAPETIPAPAAAEPILTPPAIGGQPLYPLPPSAR